MDGYVKSHFDVSSWSNNSYSDNPSVIGRMANLLKSATTTHVGKRLLPLPKIIVVVPDADILDTLKGAPREGQSKALGMLVKFIMTEHERGISSFKESLPAKAKKEGYPHILWILAPKHNNFENNDERERFNRTVEDMAKYHCNISALELKKIWDPNDKSLFENGRFTSQGFRSYWEAVDRTVRYCDAVVLRRKITKKNIKNITGQNDKYKWKNPKITDDVKRFNSFRKLPSPPQTKRRY